MNLHTQEGPAPTLCLGKPGGAYRIAIENKGPYYQVLAQDVMVTYSNTVGYYGLVNLYHILRALKSVTQPYPRNFAILLGVFPGN